MDANGSDIADGSDYGRPVVSIVATATGVPHLVYASLLGAQEVWRHATGAPRAWQLETLATAKRVYGAVALDRDGALAVLYSAADSNAPGVHYAHQQGAQWVSSVVAPTAGTPRCGLGAMTATIKIRSSPRHRRALGIPLLAVGRLSNNTQIGSTDPA